MFNDDAVYIEIMKNCSKWNTRIEFERKSRYPYIDAQTGIAQRPNRQFIRDFYDRYQPNNPSQWCSYNSKRWKRKRTAPSSDATELKFFIQCNPAINEVINQASAPPPNEMIPTIDTQNNDCYISEKKIRQTVDLILDNDADELSEDETADISEEEDWTEGRKKKKKRGPGGGNVGNRSGSRKSNAAGAHSLAASNDPKAYACLNCGAKYKSRPGLNYHRAHVHPDAVSPCMTPQPPNMFHSGVEVSLICDLCLGDRNENKRSGAAEQLVSCHDCGRSGHPSCLKFTENMIISTNKYGWQCIECKSCAICGYSDNDDQLLFCDDCDRGFHLYCLRPPLSNAPEGEWSCYLCQKQFGAKASLPALKSQS